MQVKIPKYDGFLPLHTIQRQRVGADIIDIPWDAFRVADDPV